MSWPVRAAILVASAFAAWGFWIVEVCWIKGWAGLAWLQGYTWSAVPACAVIVGSASLVLAPRAPVRERTSFIASGFAVGLGAFALARAAMFELCAGGAIPPARFDAASAAELVIAWLGASAGLAVATDRWLAPLRVWATPLVAVALLLVLPLAFATIRVFPAVNGSVDDIHAIKMGYPVFWTALVVPIALELAKRRPPEAP